MTFSKEQSGDAFYVLPRPCVLGEGPIYRASDRTLHYVDCLASPKNPPQLHILQLNEKGDPVYPSTDFSVASTDNISKSKPGLRVIPLEDSVTVMFFRKGVPGSYICLYYQGIAYMDESTGKLDIVKEIIPTSDRGIRRFNDGAVDAKGRLWAAEIDVKKLALGAGNIPAELGEPLARLWRYDPRDSSCVQVESGLVCGNGLAWSPDNTKMYLNDSAGQLIYSYDFDLETGDISNKKIFFDARGTSDEPDGMVADTEGNLWIAMFNGGGVKVLNSNGDLIKFIETPCKSPACTTWGGPDNNILYVASGYDRSKGRVDNDQGGHLFKIPTQAHGLTKNEYAG